jgi:hypothetical protein
MKASLKAATLVESLVAMTVIMLSISISVLIFTNILNTGNHYRKLEADLTLKEASFRIKAEKLFIDGTESSRSFRIKKEFRRQAESADLVLMHLTASDSLNRVVAERTELFRE